MEICSSLFPDFQMSSNFCISLNATSYYPFNWIPAFAGMTRGVYIAIFNHIHVYKNRFRIFVRGICASRVDVVRRSANKDSARGFGLRVTRYRYSF